MKNDDIVIIVELFCGRRLPNGAPRVSKAGNLSIGEILVLTSAYARPPVQTLGKREGNPKSTRREGGECHLSLAGNRVGLLGIQRFSLREIARPSSLLKKRFLLKLSFFIKTIVRQY